MPGKTSNAAIKQKILKNLDEQDSLLPIMGNKICRVELGHSLDFFINYLYEQLIDKNNEENNFALDLEVSDLFFDIINILAIHLTKKPNSSANKSSKNHKARLTREISSIRGIVKSLSNVKSQFEKIQKRISNQNITKSDFNVSDAYELSNDIQDDIDNLSSKLSDLSMYFKEEIAFEKKIMSNLKHSMNNLILHMSHSAINNLFKTINTDIKNMSNIQTHRQLTNISKRVYEQAPFEGLDDD